MIKRNDSDKRTLSSFIQSFFSGMASAILASVTALFVAYMNLLSKDKAPTINIGGFSIPREIQLTLVSLLLVIFFVLTISSIRKWIVRFRDSKQEPMDSFIGIVSDGDYRMECVCKDGQNHFLFECDYSLSPNPYINNISGPLCCFDLNDPCTTELREKKTLLGKYKHECDSCGRSYTSNFSAWTLQKRAENVALSNIKRESRIGKMIDRRFL